jgi:uncharacterized metal-binding protein YceD (DUF177 family)
MRQVAILALPIKPVCHEDCPGLPEAVATDDDLGDRRLGVLGQLLDDEGSDQQGATADNG